MKKKTFFIIFFVVLLVTPFAYSDTVWDFLTRGLADKLYCQITGCTFEGDINLAGHVIYNGSVGNLTIGNITHIEVTGDSNFNGDIYVNGISYLFGNVFIPNQAFIGGVNSTSATITAQTAHWKMNDDTSDSLVTDSSGSNDGTVVNDENNFSSEQSVAGKINKMFEFDGSNDYVDFGDVVNVGTNDFSVAFWGAANAASGVYIQKIRDSGSPHLGSGWAISISSTNRIEIRLSDTDGATPPRIRTSATIHGDGVLRHYVVTFDRDGDITVFVNGVSAGMDGSADISANSGTLTNTHSLFMGANYDQGVTPDLHLDGEMDDVRIWDNYLVTQAEAIALYNNGQGTEDNSVGSTHQVISISDSYTSSHGLDSLADLAIEGELEVNGDSFIDGETTFGDDIHLADDIKACVGTADDMCISYNGSRTQFNNEVGTGDFVFPSGNVKILTGNLTYREIYGEMHFHLDEGGVTIPIPGVGVWVNVTAFNGTGTNMTSQYTNGFTFDPALGALTCDLSMRISTWYTFSTGNAGNNQEYQWSLAKNDVLQEITDAHRKIGAAGDVGTTTGGGSIVCAPGDVIQLQVRNNDGNADLTSHASTIVLRRIGQD